jgi:hypothetical protein
VVNIAGLGELDSGWRPAIRASVPACWKLPTYDGAIRVTLPALLGKRQGGGQDKGQNERGWFV